MPALQQVPWSVRHFPQESLHPCLQPARSCQESSAHCRRSCQGQLPPQGIPVCCPKTLRNFPCRILPLPRSLFRIHSSLLHCRGRQSCLQLLPSGSCPAYRRLRHCPRRRLQGRLQDRLLLTGLYPRPRLRCLCLLYQSFPLRRMPAPQPDRIVCPQPMQLIPWPLFRPYCPVRGFLLCLPRPHRPFPRASPM